MRTRIVRAQGERRSVQAHVTLDCRNQHGEGVLWSAADALLMWTDISGRRICTYDPAANEFSQYPTPGKVCCFAPRKGRSWNEIVVAFSDGFAFLDVLTGARRDIAAIEQDKPSTRMNDGRTDRQGRFIAGGMDEAAGAPISAVWRLDPDLSVVQLFDGVGCANGSCFAPDGRTLWFADSAKGEIERFDYDVSTGSISGRRSVARTPAPGVPDGSCVDAEGFVWNAVWEGYRIERYAPDGRLDATVEVPVKKPTCCAFGGRDLDILFITSSRLGESQSDLEREPSAGSLFSVKPGVLGLVDQPFGG
jgi:L-arabinonolactonase